MHNDGNQQRKRTLSIYRGSPSRKEMKPSSLSEVYASSNLDFNFSFKETVSLAINQQINPAQNGLILHETLTTERIYQS